MAESMKKMAAEINGYLKKFEADSGINKSRGGSAQRPYFMAGAWSGSRYIGICYVSYQGTTYLTRPESEQYLAFLRQGGTGKHPAAGIDVFARKGRYARKEVNRAQ